MPSDLGDEMRRLIRGVHAEFDRLWENQVVPRCRYRRGAASVWRPDSDVYETDTSYVIRLAVAGCGSEDVDVVLEGDTLSISGSRRDTAGHAKSVVHQMEIDYGYFERAYRLPAPVDPEQVTAELRNGLLEIMIRKAAHRPSTPRTVKISL